MSLIRHALPKDPPYLKAAFGDLNLKERAGAKHNPRILQMFAAAGHGWVQDDETAWCAAAVGAWLSESGYTGSRSLAARSYLKWGKKTNRPKRGDIVVFKRGNHAWQGHVALYLGEAAGKIYVIGGNQSNAVTIAGYSRSRLLGFRRPATVWNSKVVAAAGTVGATSGAGLLEYTGHLHDALVLITSLFGGEGEDGKAVLEPETVTSWLQSDYIAIGAFVLAMGLCGFIVWDRFIKARELGI